MISLVMAMLILSNPSTAQLIEPSVFDMGIGIEDPPDEVEGPSFGSGYSGEVPVDGGLSLLLAAGSVLGYRQIKRRKGR
jgi:hypothetical protein